MLAVIILLIQLFTVEASVPVSIDDIKEVLSVNGKTNDAQLVNEWAFILQRMLLRRQYEENPNNEVFKKYVIALEKALVPNKRTFPANRASTDLKFDQIDEFCAEMLNFPEVILKLEACGEGEEWNDCCNTYKCLLNYFDSVFEMLARNNALPVGSNECSSGGEKKRFSSGLVHGLILNEISGVVHKNMVKFKNTIDGLFDILHTIIMKGESIRSFSNGSPCNSTILQEIQDSLNRAAFIARNAKQALKEIYDSENTMEVAKYHTLRLLIISVEYILGCFSDYKNLIKNCSEEADKNLINDNFKAYADRIGSTIIYLFNLAVLPTHWDRVADTIKPSYDEVIRKTEDKCTPNPAVNADRNNQSEPWYSCCSIM